MIFAKALGGMLSLVITSFQTYSILPHNKKQPLLEKCAEQIGIARTEANRTTRNRPASNANKVRVARHEYLNYVLEFVFVLPQSSYL